jgi:hypothetical protein
MISWGDGGRFAFLLTSTLSFSDQPWKRRIFSEIQNSYEGKFRKKKIRYSF